MQNLRYVFDKADKADVLIAEKAWVKMNRLCGQMADKHGFELRTAAAVFAALSPNNDYHGNLRDTDRTLAAAKAGIGIDDFKVSTYGNNKRKAWRIANGEEPLDLIVFNKTRNFFLNVYDPSDPWPVTVDGHVQNIWRGKRVSLKGAAQTMRPKLYNIIANDIREFSRHKGIIPNIMQGILWYSWRRMHGILYSPQLELWDVEALAARVGWTPSRDLKY